MPRPGKTPGPGRSWPSWVPAIGVLAAGGMAVLALAQGDAVPFPAVLTGVLFLVFTLALGVFNHSQARRSRAWGDQVLDRFSVKTPEELEGVLEDYRARAAAADQAAQQVRLVREGLSDRKARRENSRKDLFDFVHSFAPEVKDLFGCSAALSRALNLGDREAVAHTKLEGAQRLYDALKAQGGQVEEPGAPEPEVPQRTMEETAALLGTAQADLGAHRPGPEHGPGPSEGGGGPRRSGRPPGGAGGGAGAAQPGVPGHLHRSDRPEGGQCPAPGALLPGAQPPCGGVPGPAHRGKVHQPLPEPGAGGLRRRGGGCAPRRSLFLSKGTVDQVYLAVRLAVYDLCLREHHVPLILDDALAAFDQERMERALDLLVELSREEQILFFTCQSREGTYLARTPGVERVALDS